MSPYRIPPKLPPPPLAPDFDPTAPCKACHRGPVRVGFWVLLEGTYGSDYAAWGYICTVCQSTWDYSRELGPTTKSLFDRLHDFFRWPIMSRPILVKDLKDQTGTPEPRPILHCVQCDETFSANKGDYFMHPPDHVLKHCGEPMELAVVRVVYERVPVES